MNKEGNFIQMTQIDENIAQISRKPALPGYDGRKGSGFFGGAGGGGAAFGSRP